MNKVTVGLATKLGLAKTLFFGLVAIVQSIEDNQALLHGTNKPAALLAFGSGIVTIGGRMYQAAHLPGGDQVAALTADIPAELAELAADSQAALAAGEADGKDGPQVPNSGA